MLKIGVHRGWNVGGDTRYYNKETLHILAENGPLNAYHCANILANNRLGTRDLKHARLTKSIASRLIQKKSGRLKELSEKSYIAIRRGENPLDLDIIFPTIKGILAAIYDDISEDNIKSEYFMIDVLNKIDLPKGYTQTIEFFNYLSWLDYRIITKTFLKYWYDNINIEYSNANFDNIDLENVTAFFRNCIGKYRNKILNQLKKDGVLNNHIDRSCKDLIDETLSWFNENNYSKDIIYLYIINSSSVDFIEFILSNYNIQELHK